MKIPSTAATRALKQARIDFVARLFAYEARGGTRHSAEVLGVDEHTVIKTLIFESDARRPMCVLMHGDAQVSTKALARHIGCKAVSACSPDAAQRFSGYQVGGTSPFGLRREMPIYAQRTIFELDTIRINGGSRGFLIEIAPAVLEALLTIERVDVRAVRA